MQEQIATWLSSLLALLIISSPTLVVKVVEQILSQAIIFMHCYQQSTLYPTLLYDSFSGLIS